MMVNFIGRNRNPTGSFRLEPYAAMVQHALQSLNVNPDQARVKVEDGFGWVFWHGSATIEVYVRMVNNAGIFQAVSPIMHLPQSGLLPLYRRLLELNLEIANFSVGVYLDVVYVFSERPLEGMDQVEAASIISAVADWADELDDQLVAEFGGRQYGRA